MTSALIRTPPSGGRVEWRAAGRAVRKACSRSSHGDWSLSEDRPDPLSVLAAQDEGRVEDLVALRYERMLQSPFTFFRGSAAVMAWDLAHAASTGMVVQACGDAHVANFGGYGSPERRLVYDINDFDETAPAPWEYDLKRLAASLVLDARDSGFSEAVAAEGVEAAVKRYASITQTLSQLPALEVHYSSVETEAYLSRDLSPKLRKSVRRWERKARRRNQQQAYEKWVDQSGAVDRFKSQPPLLRPVSPSTTEELREAFHSYRLTLPSHRRLLLDQYRFVDTAHKVVGVGSVGLRSYVVLLEGPGHPDPLLLQFKQAVGSVLETHAGVESTADHAQRVVKGQQIMQATSDPFLGSVKMGGRHYYVRQLRDMKSVTGAAPNTEEFKAGSELMGGTLARAHSRSRDPSWISGYLGSGRRFAQAIVRFARRYADQAERDYEYVAKHKT